jgi:hypothetical protein
MPRIAFLTAVVLPLSLLAACTDTGPRTHEVAKGSVHARPTDSADEQIQRLNARARAMPLIAGAAPENSVLVRYPDDEGKPHRDSFAGRLWIRQHFDTQPPAADIAFFGTVVGQTLLDAGKNDTEWWCVLKVNGKHAWTGEVKNLAAQPEGQASIFRVDRVLDVLAVTLIEPQAGFSVTMRRSRNSNIGDSNILRFSRARPGGGAPVLEREITIDRRTGLPTDVRLFDAEGQEIVTSHLDTYRPVEYEDAAAAPKAADIPLMPHHIILNYPAAKSSIEINFSSVYIPKSILPRVFETRDWEDLDIKPEIIK